MKIDKPLAKLTKRYRESIQINNIRSEKRDITTETGYFKRSDISTKVYTRKKMGNLDKMHDFSKQIAYTKVKSK